MKLRNADVLARTLAAAGTKYVFTLSGNHVMAVFDAAPEAGLSLVHVRHEAAAVHMADAWGRLTGEPGVALVTGGPGHANALSALYTALAADSPLVLISGHAPLAELGKGAFQEMRQARNAYVQRSVGFAGEDVEHRLLHPASNAHSRRALSAGAAQMGPRLRGDDDSGFFRPAFVFRLFQTCPRIQAFSDLP